MEVPERSLAWVLDRVGASLRLVERETPRPGQGEALVRVEACGLCGSDRLLRDGGFGSESFPLIPGHEAAGTVVELGPGEARRAKNLIGKRVAMYYIEPDTGLEQQANRENLGNVRRMGVDVDGALAQYVVRPVSSLLDGRGLSAPELAVLSDAVATPYHALRLADPSPGSSIVVLGTGGIGSNAVQLAAQRAAHVVAVGRSSSKLTVARRLGAATTLSSSQGAAQIVNFAGGKVDLVLQCVGSAEMDQLALEIVSPGGTIVFVGASPENVVVSSFSLIQREITIRGSRGFTKQDIEDVISLYRKGSLTLDHLLTDIRGFGEAGRAFEMIGQTEHMRTVIDPGLGLDSIGSSERGALHEMAQ